ncbi:beta-ketoacyl synthase N-terminal-like domain-containing protein [Cellulomonas shaoxiangyii]|uniref:3-oxoacyl-ACP synthase n=1 Tax=Cellulomonas shaoxiangyii TaxID=2566013 RepID=A0A4P7SIL9_9CELL|nr:beta-ketoacyl synthase N-terminal-like domain-containing protein [Cellulomonas shaoxiangyii]QCB92303.1 3-oxoacyl-ACP synthase [Cellulomonas shaoxiangyii]TGY78199.1 3-oxoacyl-ACP synthase [Cellulomonas shaoxiangyii]
MTAATAHATGRAPEAAPGAAPPAVTGVLAGTGATCSVGHGVEASFAALLDGRDGLAPLRGLDARRYGAGHAYEVDDRPDGRDVPGRAGALLVAAVREAADAAGLGTLAGVPVLVGTGLRELRSLELSWLRRADGPDPDRVPAPFGPDDLHFGPALRALGADDVHTFSNACSASLYAAGLALDLLALGHPAVVVGGVDVLTSSMFGLLDRVHLDPPERLRPFDAARKGVLMGEGAAAVVLTRGPAPGAAARDAAAGASRATLLRAVALGCDAFHATAPDPDGVERTIRAAHAAAGVGPRDVDVVYAHGTGTLLNDEAEAVALSRVFGADAPVTAAVKGATGHTSGGSGLFSLVMAERTLATGLVPGVRGLREPTPAAAGLRLPTGTVRIGRSRIAQVDAFGFGGLNAVAVLERTGTDAPREPA